MDASGLPIAFGKQGLPPKPTPGTAEAAQPARGGPSGRGPRGAVGVGKKSRRGRGGHAGEGVVPAGPDAQAFNEGVKRSFPTSPEQPNASERPGPQGQSSDRGWGGFRGGRGGRNGGPGHPNDTPGDNWLKPSFYEDPWKSLMDARARRLAAKK